MKGKTVLVTGVLIIFFTAAGFMVGRMTAPAGKRKPTGKKQNNNNVMVEKRSGGYKFINPLWECDNFNPSELNSIVQLRNDIRAHIQQVLEAKKAEHVSVYFRDLNSGPWVGINEKDNFSPASLLKVPILIAALKKCENEPSFLKNKIVFHAKRDDQVNPNIVDTAFIKTGSSYTVEDLMYRMIVYSDNQAKELLSENIGYDLFVKVMKDIGIDVSTVTAADDFISVKDYSSFFRLLFNATYLNKEMSEKALEILSQSGFPEGIKAGVPKDMIVAHKFGERAFSNSNIRQLHDCGIIYNTGSPYLLCVMTRGNDFQQLASVIAGVSEVVYRNVTQVGN